MEITNEAQKGYIINLFLNISIEIKFYFTFLVVK